MMQFEIFWQKLKKLIERVESNDGVFNQYLDHNPYVDVPEAASIRMENLKAYLKKKLLDKPQDLVVGEAPSPWGTRFSGVPFAAEKQLIDPQFPIKGNRSSKDDPEYPTRMRPPYCSNADKIFWTVMLEYNAKFLTWNAFPFHPHKPDDKMSIRNPRNEEVAQCGETLILIKKCFKPIRIIAVGRIAERHLRLLGETPKYVRHPAHGGTAEFTSEMRRLFETI